MSKDGKETRFYFVIIPFLVISSLHQKKRNYQFTNSPIHEFKVLQKGQRAFWNPFLMVYYFLFITLKNILSLDFFILKALKDILQHFELVNSWIRGFNFDVTKRLLVWIFSKSMRSFLTNVFGICLWILKKAWSKYVIGWAFEAETTNFRSSFFKVRWKKLV